jgi:hypothetical protein
VPDNVAEEYPSIVHLRVQFNRLEGQTPAENLLSCIIKALKAQNSCGMHTKIHRSHKFLRELFERLQFKFLSEEDGFIFLGRKI